jgi:hypothetical protein
VGPYRQPGEDTEALLLDREIADFRALTLKHARRVRVRVLVTVAASLVMIGVLCKLILVDTASRPVSSAPQRCETHMITPENSASFPMVVCW